MKESENVDRIKDKRLEYYIRKKIKRKDQSWNKKTRVFHKNLPSPPLTLISKRTTTGIIRDRLVLTWGSLFYTSYGDIDRGIDVSL